MKKEGYYSSGQFAKKANVTVRTIRYYDQQNILKPSYLTEDGVRFYTDADFTRLQQVLLLKYLGFSLDDIRDMTIGDSDYLILKNSLELQKHLIMDKIARMQLVVKAIEDTEDSIDEKRGVDWNSMLELIHLTSMEDTMKNQYLNAGNISARINLHSRFSVNKQGWFPWVYEQSGIDEAGKCGLRILEVGCGDGSFWTENIGSLAQAGRRRSGASVDETGIVGASAGIYIELTDISDGMLRDAKRNISEATKSWSGRDINVSFRYRVSAAEKLTAKNNTYDLVIANHMLFYCEDVNAVIKELFRVLKPGGKLICSTYGSNHMKEISKLAQGFDKRIQLEDKKLYETFGLENGEEQLTTVFGDVVEKRVYEDALIVDEAEPVVSYILSCHGNQKEYLLDRYGEFKAYVTKKLTKPLKICKEAGVFIATKK